eukprot:TRINITY_DN18860_c0_g1_i5.p3 TRINITY_DN18860_c0_g1~~TRINITY_DN18860_c0_g1_i5.p3  ORF type:complete len:102 (-),score=2.43 TRINITY_DN18860_c0_g1_i5:92-397(-)
MRLARFKTYIMKIVYYIPYPHYIFPTNTLDQCQFIENIILIASVWIWGEVIGFLLGDRCRQQIRYVTKFYVTDASLYTKLDKVQEEGRKEQEKCVRKQKMR